MDSNIVIVTVCLIVCWPIYYWTEVARRKKSDLKFRLKRIALSNALFVGGLVVLSHNGYSVRDAALFSFFVGVSAGFILVRPPVRNRRIPKRVRQAVIARDLKDVPFDPTLHQLDHIVPYSRGGDHSAANLRVLPKKENLQRGARMPKLRDFR